MVEKETTWKGKFVKRPDGNRYFDVTGRRHTIDEIEKAKRNRKKKLGRLVPHTRETIIKISPLWNRIRPLFLRDATTREMMALTGFTQKQVRNAIYRKSRVDWYKAPPEYYTKQKERERRVRSRLGIPRRVDRRVPTRDEMKDFEMAKNLITDGNITDDLTNWAKLSQVYAESGRELPKSFTQRLRLEVFLCCAEDVRIGKHDMIRGYKQVGSKVDPDWFKTSLTGEENFLLQKVFPNEVRPNSGIAASGLIFDH